MNFCRTALAVNLFFMKFGDLVIYRFKRTIIQILIRYLSFKKDFEATRVVGMHN